LKPKRGDHIVLPVCGCGRSLRARVLLLVCCGGVYATIFILMGGLRFPIEKDELHFWSTSLSFSHRIVPTLEQLRGYSELNTPLPFLLFGWAEYAFHGGIQVGRSINFLLSFAIAGIVCFGSNTASKRSVGSLLGLLLFPYFLGVSTHLYTDVIAAFFVLLGVVFYKKGKHALSTLCFALAVSSRQYMVAFPAAIFVHEVSNQAKTEPSLRMAWIAPLLASLSLLVWFWILGGMATKAALQAQVVSTSREIGRVFPEHGLYFLSCVGLYFVLPELLMFPDARRWKAGLERRSLLAALFVLAVLTLLFPPLGNVDYAIATMGYFDKALRVVLPDALRVLAFFAFAALATVRFSRPGLASLIVLANGLLMLKAHIAWDKYALPTLAVLWYLKSIGALDDLSVREEEGRGACYESDASRHAST